MVRNTFSKFLPNLVGLSSSSHMDIAIQSIFQQQFQELVDIQFLSHRNQPQVRALRKLSKLQLRFSQRVTLLVDLASQDKAGTLILA
jgi:hypothetical protein